MDTPDAGETPTPFDALLNTHRSMVQHATDNIRRTTAIPDRIVDAGTVDVGETPSSVVYTENKLELLHYEALTEDQHPVPILIVYALINRPYILDLQPDRSIVRRFLEAGHDVYLIDWNRPSHLDSSLGLHDYVNRYINNCVDVVRDRSGQDAINILGYCMGGTLSTMYTALYPEKVNALGLMATGLYFDDTGGVLELWGDEDYYDPAAITDAYGNVPGDFLAVGFNLMDPIGNNVSKYLQLYDRLENEDFVQNFARMETWLADSVDVAGRVYTEFIEQIYQQNRLYENELTIDDEPIDVTDIDMPFIQIVGEYDTLVPPAASKPFNDVVGSDDVTTIEYPTGHVGLAMSTSTHRDVWPTVTDWFLDRSGAPSLIDVIGDGVEQAMDVDIEADATVGTVEEVQLTINHPDGTETSRLLDRDPAATRTTLEDALDIKIAVRPVPDGTEVTVETDDTTTKTIIASPGEPQATTVREAVQDLADATSPDLTDIEGIGPTYADRLQDAGITTIEELADAEPNHIATVADAGHRRAAQWIDRATELRAPNPATDNQ